MDFKYDVIVIGAGHAGCEAAAAAANMGSKTCLITIDMTKIAQMSCNPAIGGIAKGQIVREIDALGGYMGIVTDNSSIQFRMLNRSKGPAMWSPRAQCDRAGYVRNWRSVLDSIPNLNIWQDTVTELEVEHGRVTGVTTLEGATFKARSIVLTAGTFLNGLMHIGHVSMPGGRISEPASYGLTESITRHGIRSGRMKTGTPVRIDSRSVDFSMMEKQEGEKDFHRFSFMESERNLKQMCCWTCFTNERVHEILRSGLADSPLYNGQIKSIGPRYCPSIETKLFTFPDKDRHQLFLEPEGEDTNEMYLNGFSSSMPMNIQIQALKEIPAFRDLIVYRPGYAIEYDYFDPTQLSATLESKVIKGLYMAGQVNGTTGYEEAGGQGLVAGINAHSGAHGLEPFILKRDEAYIGVLIDDLITKGVDEPYRMFTSRAEYRILLRQDDADIRLTEKAYRTGLASGERYHRMTEKRDAIERLIQFAKGFSVKPSLINPVLEKLGTTPLREGCKLADLVNRPQITLLNIAPHIKALANELDNIESRRRDEIIEAAEIRMKYSGYITRERIIADKMVRLENIRIKDKFDYDTIQSLSTEARQKLSRINPETLAQASRIPGISPSDVNVLLVLMNR
ncbi:MAG: tRNA uridine-5-carboxymethylaminomethyl(34) synthesis enzyme MnmG [Bacteroidaceae bacterium]|nr:tRNA uridine-5-carboxymethylaminomethyl(34) synthesis enzyme MnmG [Bacteroidaceae bacterium]